LTPELDLAMEIKTSPTPVGTETQSCSPSHKETKKQVTRLAHRCFKNIHNLTP